MADTGSMEPERPININITRGNKEISEKYNKFKEYIIINNLELQSTVSTLKTRICELTSDVK